MSTPGHDDQPPMGEPGKHPAGKDIGGVHASPTGGLDDAMQRSRERGEDSALGRASTACEPCHEWAAV